ncbi:flagellar basal-body MS-ring/collar protein FliF (plasmid) [Enterobacter asburiae]|uniref:flagellar basal-body MS-ring/collar protein FliF n=1 Tax=Enterobacter asburiae TaxID=61645 RepID=UPI0029327C17|nr:flagellar M-ring protein FliF [Enterobacter asburiae]EMA4739816.1 flagellar M-ring protein FliF [Enterobacter asburiae]
MNATTNSKKNYTINNLVVAFERLRANPKVMILVSAAAAISFIIAAVLWTQGPSWRVLYSNISDQDGGAIVTQLTQMNVPYRFEAQTGVIMVPEDQVHESRLRLAQQGLPKGGAVGFELLDKETFGISQFSEQVNFQRALEGELSRTIEMLGPVRSARVHLAIPKPSLFVREQLQPTASVTVTLEPGRSLESGQVSAISWLVSSAVPALNADRITIVDQRGHLLSQKDEQGLQTSKLKYTAEIEADYQNRIQAILAPIVGAENVRAQVKAQIDFTTYEQTAEQYQPNTSSDKMAIRSRQSSSAEQGGKNQVGGVPGALSNQPPVPATAPIVKETPTPTQDKQNQTLQKGGNDATSTTPFSVNSDETTNYELDRTLTHIKRSTGNIERLSVAVVVNHIVDSEGKPATLTSQQMEQINALVKETVGFSAARGDTLNIINSAFSSADDEPTIPLWQEERFINLLLAAARYLFIAIIAWVLWRKAIQPAWLRHQEMALQRLELEKEARQAELDAMDRNKEITAKAKAQQRVDTELNTQYLRNMAEHDPKVIALVLRRWMNKEIKGK